jgi:outer membrane protein TolC
MNKKRVIGLFVLLSIPVRPAHAQDAPKELTLARAVDIALKNNPTLKAADAYAEAVRRGISEAQASRYPRLDFSEGFTRGNNPVYVFGSLLTQRQFTEENFALPLLNVPPPLNNFRTQFSATLPLYDAGQISRRARDARLDAESAERARERTSQEVIFNVITAYLNVLLASESMRVAKAYVASTQKDLERAQARQEAGQALLSDVLSAQVQLAQAKEALIRARNGVAVAQAALNVAMGVAEDTPEQIRGKLSETVFETGTLAERQQRALAARPDYQQILLGRDKAQNGVSMARAGFLPTLGAFGSWELDNQKFAAQGGNNWIAGATFNFNLFDGGSRRAQLGESRARERQAEAMREQMAATIRLQVRQAFLNMTAASARKEVSRESASQAQESLRILQDRYDSGLATITDVLSAEAAHARAQQDFLSALYDYRLAYATLELATGELGPGSQVLVR